MNFHTDLALERQELCAHINSENIKVHKEMLDNIKITKINVLNQKGALEIDKPVGTYITIEVPEFSHESELMDYRLSILVDSIRSLLPLEKNNILIAGLGNENITPDALGPRTINGIFATRHINEATSSSLGLGHLNSVSAISLGVLGQTGLESKQIIFDIVKDIQPNAVILIDALASRSRHRLGNTIQMTNTGLVPGSGVGNHRCAINQDTIGVPVIAIGVPTVIDLECLIAPEQSSVISQKEIEQMMVCPREIDTIIHRASKFLSLAINCAVQPSLSPELLLSIV